MGGIAIVGSVVIGYAVGHIGTEIRFSRTGYLTIGAVVAFGLIGYLDDYIKIHLIGALGLNKRAKSGAQLACALLFAILAVDWAHTSTALSFTRSEAIDQHRLGPGIACRPAAVGPRTPWCEHHRRGGTGWAALERSTSRSSRSWATGSSGTS